MILEESVTIKKNTRCVFSIVVQIEGLRIKRICPSKKNSKLSKNAASPLAGEPPNRGVCLRRLRRRKMFELSLI